MVSFLVLTLNLFGQDVRVNKSVNNKTLSDSTIAITARTLVSKMTLRQKVFEMHGHGIIPFGFSHVFGNKIKPIKAGGNTHLAIPSAIFYDGPRGLFHYKGATSFPTTMARSASWDPSLERRIGEAMAEEIRALGGNYSGAVCMNLLRHPAWGRAQETYGEDPFQNGEMASALVEGLQKHAVQACVKHFAGNSMENNRFGGNVIMDERTLHEVYLPHFKKVIEHGAASVMSAYNRFNGEYCGENRHLLDTILRQTLGFRGYVTSDWSYGIFDAAKAIDAGMNVEMPNGKVYKLSVIKRLVKNGRIKQTQIDEIVFQIVRTKLCFAQMKDYQRYSKAMIGSKLHIDLALEAAEKSAVLLKNDSQCLPLFKAKVKRIAVIGSLASVRQTGDQGSSSVRPAYIVSPLDGLRNYFKGTATEVLTVSSSNIDSVRAVCAKADAVVVVAGTTSKDEGEYIGNFTIRDSIYPDKHGFVVSSGILGLGGDRKYLHLPQNDIDVIHAASGTNQHVIVTLVAGSAVTVEEWHKEVSAIVQTFYNGMEGGTALAKILFGDVNPSGKLPFSVPVNEKDLPEFNSYAKAVKYGYYHGYSLFDKSHQPVRYSFGFGLSYTTFAIRDARIKQNVASDSGNYVQFIAKVKNTGNRTGAEVVQLYIDFSESKMDRPIKLLRGFEKVYLAPGEEKELTFHVPYHDLAYYDSTEKKWRLEPMHYKAIIGTYAGDRNALSIPFSIDM